MTESYGIESIASFAIEGDLGYDIGMKVTEATLLADRIVVTIRWLTLVGLSILLAMGNGFDRSAAILISVSAVLNLGFSIVALVGRRVPQHEYVTVGVDGVIGALFFFMTGIQNVPFFWAAILPIMTASFYFGIYGGLIGAGVMLVVQFVGLTMVVPFVSALALVGVPAVVETSVGLVFGFAAQLIGQQFRQKRAEEVGRMQQVKQLERQRIKAIYEITTSLGTTLNYEQVLDMALDLTANALSSMDTDVGKLVSAFYVIDPAITGMYVGSARRYTVGDLKVTMMGRDGVVEEAMRRGESRLIGSPSEDPDLRRLISLRECSQVYVYPLRTVVERYGLLVFGHPDEDFFTDQRQEILEIVGRQSQIALQNARLYRELIEEKERMMDIQEDARKKLARNLHDGPTQSVAAIAMRVNFARRLMDRDAKAAGDEMFKIEELARRTTKEIRHMLFTLRPLVLESAGLRAALESMAEKMRDTYDQNVIIEVDDGCVENMDMSKQGVVFYISEEGVNNARKHAEAEHVWVRLKPVDEFVSMLEIQDDGVGFNVGAVDSGYENRGSLGMVNMRERTELLNGILKVESEVGVGTRIRVFIPVNEEAAAKLRHG